MRFPSATSTNSKPERCLAGRFRIIVTYQSFIRSVRLGEAGILFTENMQQDKQNACTNLEVSKRDINEQQTREVPIWAFQIHNSVYLHVACCQMSLPLALLVCIALPAALVLNIAPSNKRSVPTSGTPYPRFFFRVSPRGRRPQLPLTCWFLAVNRPRDGRNSYR